MAKKSAGLLLYRTREGRVEVFLVHMGGPFWKDKDLGAWSIPKGEYGEGEKPFDAARREFEEETGFTVDGDFTPLKPMRQPGGKHVTAWAVGADVDASQVKSNTYRIEWPKGTWRTYPEVDRAEWFALDEARRRILKGQLPLVEELTRLLGAG